MKIFKALPLMLLALFLTSCSSDKIKHISSTNIAILMPITGPNARLGQRLASMIELGLDDSLQGNIKVITYDIAEESRIPVVVSKLKARGTMLVLGPIFSSNAQSIIPQIQPYGITMITLSNNPALASQNVFVFGHAPMKQTQRIIDYTLAAGYKDYIMLLPASKYSREMTNIVSNMVQEKGGKIIQTEFYSDKQESIDIAVQNIANIVHNINETEDSTMKPVLYVSDDTSLMKDVANELKKHNLDIQTLLIGDNKLDIVYDQPISFLFTGSMRSYDDVALDKAKTFIGANSLHDLDLVAYDLGKITSYNLGQNLMPEQFLARLNSGHLHLGASGAIKFVGGVADRKYDIIRRDANGYSLVDEGR
jgi:outer membrane PBP1 activator LpoA protein